MNSFMQHSLQKYFLNQTNTATTTTTTKQQQQQNQNPNNNNNNNNNNNRYLLGQINNVFVLMNWLS